MTDTVKVSSVVESLLAVGLTTTGMKLWETIKLKSPDILLEPKLMDELGQRKMNRDQALSTTYSTILKIHKKVVGRRSPGSIGPAATKGEAAPRKMRKKIPTSRQVLTTTNEFMRQGGKEYNCKECHEYEPSIVEKVV
ncbi:hypothetical protein CMV_021979 [Castanea mollissima]|uniref:Uncharacterized protein n=1 Tax=Castanea mollissima TaxID=60419 RepID=A0A8J4QIS6_9ROSI|nr:hypothetical protein CMV_021979 [Castanea mollissima]